MKISCLSIVNGRQVWWWPCDDRMHDNFKPDIDVCPRLWQGLLIGFWEMWNYRQFSNISRNKSQQSKDSRTVLRLFLPNPLKPMLSREWRCSWSSADRRCSNNICVIDNFIAYQGVPYIRGFTVILQVKCSNASYDLVSWELPVGLIP